MSIVHAVKFFSFNSIFAGYGDTNVLKGISASLGQGEVLGILGRNGVGKSTLLKALTGVVRPTSGVISVSGKDVTSIAPNRRRAVGISYAPQERVVFDGLTVADNLALPFSRRGSTPYKDMLADFPRLSERAQQLAGKLSGGEKKILSFVRVISERSPITLIDEPSEGVAQENLERMARIIRDRAADGASFVIVEQNLDFLMSVADRYLGLDHGEVVLESIEQATTKAELESVLSV
ncbi:ATP-binding cassette domain-containing protein [Paraburkholderia bannensis]|uniref:ATP-binding cassette domain-containing protein n=1 Tax=Paraburkholderia bannensis TaxID=765414 RepID=UPI002AB79B9C|nr:ATP-binding cassette domain-containing protein [Paraburkholderia bannensis]